MKDTTHLYTGEYILNIFNLLEQHLIRQGEKSDLQQEILNAHRGIKPSPFHVSYYSPLCPGWLENYHQVSSDINFFKVRNGAIDIVNFFLENPCPSKKSTSLIFNLRLKPLIPDSWRQQVLFFENRLNGHPLRNKDSITSLFLYGSNLESLASIENELSKIKSNCTLIFFYLKSSQLRECEAKFNVQIAHLARKFPNADFTFTDLENNLPVSQTYKNCIFLDLDHAQLDCSDNFLEHYFFSREAQPQRASSEYIPRKTIELTYFHHEAIFDWEDLPESNCMDFYEDIKILKSLKSQEGTIDRIVTFLSI